MTSATHSLPLDGIFVADFSRVLAGPLCTQLLGDAGARVIKIEEPGRGDETRRWGPPFVDGISAYFLSINRNKESFTLDLKSEEGAVVARELIRRADVVIENFLPAQRANLGLDEITRLSPRAVHCSISGFDADSAERATPGYDLLAQAGSGLMAITGEADGDPMKVGVALSDVLTGHYAFGAIAAALVARERTGQGAHVEVSLFSATLASLVNVAQSALLTEREARRFGNEHPSIVPYQLFRGADRSFALGAGTDRHFRQLCERVIDRPELAIDSRFATNEARVGNRERLLPLLGEIFRGRNAGHWVERCREAAIPVSLVQGPLEALRSEPAAALLQTVAHPVLGDYLAVGHPVRFDGQRLPIRTAPPGLGADSSNILRELGYDDARIASMRERGIV